MAWFYDQTAPNSGVDPTPQNSTISGHLEKTYQFFQSTDPRAIQLYTMLAKGGVAGLWGPFNTLDEAKAQAAKAAPTDPGTITQNITGGGNFFGVGSLFDLNAGGWLLRIGEIVLGVVLIAVGVAKLTGIQNKIATAAKVAAKV